MTKQEEKEENLDDLLKKADLTEKTELGEVTKEFSINKPSSSNLTEDEMKLLWRAESILEGLGAVDSLKILTRYIDLKRSVRGWNTEQKVAAITGVQQQRAGFGGKIMETMFGQRK